MLPRSMHQKVVIPGNVLYRNLNGEAVALNLSSELYFGLDEIACRMWEVLTTSDSLDQARLTLLDEFDVEPDVLEQDLNEFIGKLVENGLVQLVG